MNWLLLFSLIAVCAANSSSSHKAEIHRNCTDTFINFLYYYGDLSFDPQRTSRPRYLALASTLHRSQYCWELIEENSVWLTGLEIQRLRDKFNSLYRRGSDFDESGRAAGAVKIHNLVDPLLIPIDWFDRDGRSLLTLAAMYGNVEAVQQLVRMGAYLNFQDFHGETALMKAARWCEPKMIELMLQYGANVNISSRDGKSAVWYAKRCRASWWRKRKVVSLLRSYGGR
jgi:hypothetical protein